MLEFELFLMDFILEMNGFVLIDFGFGVSIRGRFFGINVLDMVFVGLDINVF